MKTKSLIIIMLITIGIVVFSSCTSPQPIYKKISPSDAQKLIQTDSSVLLLDVRTSAEYEEMHIPGSTLLPIDEIGAQAETLLHDKGATIIVRPLRSCLSGNRSQAAAKQLLGMGYKKVYDLGGIINWPYETEVGK
jgi:rhodanese-related sulfurtransferase